MLKTSSRSRASIVGKSGTRSLLPCIEIAILNLTPETEAKGNCAAVWQFDGNCTTVTLQNLKNDQNIQLIRPDLRRSQSLTNSIRHTKFDDESGHFLSFYQTSYFQFILQYCNTSSNYQKLLSI